jgi:hypothetical protein
VQRGSNNGGKIPPKGFSWASYLSILASLMGQCGLQAVEFIGDCSAARISAWAVASTWHSRALVCAEVCRIGERVEPAPTSTQAERERLYSAEYDEQERYDIRRGAERMPSLEGTCD